MTSIQRAAVALTVVLPLLACAGLDQAANDQTAENFRELLGELEYVEDGKGKKDTKKLLEACIEDATEGDIKPTGYAAFTVVFRKSIQDKKIEASELKRMESVIKKAKEQAKE